MARKPGSSFSGSTGKKPTSARSRSGAEAIDVRGWLGGVRLSGFMAIMLALIVLAVFVLMPTLATYLDQRQRIAALEEAVKVGKDTVEQLEVERDRWQDPAFVTTQARERLFFVMPGEIVYLVDNDIESEEAEVPPTGPVSADVTNDDGDWMARAARSVTESGLSRTAAGDAE